MTAQEKIDQLTATVLAGKTLYICTPLRKTKVTQQTLALFAKRNRPLFKVIKDGMWMSHGTSYVCINYCQFLTD